MAWLLAAAALVQSDELLRNGDFDNVNGEMPGDWSAIAPAEFQKTCEFGSDAKHARRGRCGVVRNTNPANRQVTALSQRLDGETARAMRGKPLELVTWIRTYEATWADARIVCLDEGDREIAAHRTHAYGSAWGTTEWTRYVARGVVPEKTRALLVRCVVRGIGEAWFDDVSLRPAKETAPSPPPEVRDEHRKFRDAASKFVLGADREAVKAFSSWTPEQVEAALAGGLGPSPWASGFRRMSGYEVWIPAEAKDGARPLLVVIGGKDAHKPWAEIARDMFVVRADPDVAALRDACARFPVDADRVYATSASFAMAHAGRIAGVASLGERLDAVRAMTSRLGGMAWWISHGDADRESPIAEARGAVEALRAASIEHVWREHAEASHDDVAIDRGNAIEWLSRRKRERVAPVVDGGGHAKADGNTVTLEGARGTVRVWLGPRHVDLSKPVKVVAGGRTVFEGAVSPSFDVFLERLAATGDSRATGWACVEVRVE